MKRNEKTMRYYTKIDMLRIIKFQNEPQVKELKGVKLLAAYDNKYAKLTEKQKVVNLCKSLNMPGLYKKLTGLEMPAN